MNWQSRIPAASCLSTRFVGWDAACPGRGSCCSCSRGPMQVLLLCFDVAGSLPRESQSVSAWRCCLKSLLIKYHN